MRRAHAVNREMYLRFRDYLIRNGVLWGQGCYSHCGITAAHTTNDIEKILRISEGILEEMAKEER